MVRGNEKSQRNPQAKREQGKWLGMAMGPEPGPGETPAEPSLLTNPFPQPEFRIAGSQSGDRACPAPGHV